MDDAPTPVSTDAEQPPKKIERQTLGWTRTNVFLTALALIIVVYQTYLLIQQTDLARTQTKLAEKQTGLAQKQTELAERQDKIISDQLARRAKLALVVEEEGTSGEAVLLRIYVRNDGTKTASAYFWQLLIPVVQKEVRPETSPGGGLFTSAGTTNIEGVVYQVYRGYVGLPLFQTRLSDLLRLRVPHAKPGEPRDFKILWALVSEDGEFPDAGKAGEVLIRKLVTN